MSDKNTPANLLNSAKSFVSHKWWFFLHFVIYCSIDHPIKSRFNCFCSLIITFTNQKDDPSTRWKGYMYCLAIFGSALVQSFCLHQYFHAITTIGMNLRTAIIGMVYPKVMLWMTLFYNVTNVHIIKHFKNSGQESTWDNWIAKPTIWPTTYNVSLAELYDSCTIKLDHNYHLNLCW